MMRGKLHRVFASVLVAAALLAQEPFDPAFHASARLVQIAFNVQRGKDFAADLQPSDFILREDGHPRPFTTFEGPHSEHPLPLELDLLFDTTVVPPKIPNLFHWDPKIDYEFINSWDERLTAALLQEHGMNILLSIYHYSGRHLERLCPATSDPREIVQAFRRLTDPIPQGTGELTLLPNSHITKPMFDAPWQGWMGESILTVLRNAVASPAATRRRLLFFTTGITGTSTPLSSMADSALALNIPLDPVLMNQNKLNGFSNRPGSAGVLATVDIPAELANKAGFSDTGYKNLPWIADAAEMTGGELFVPPQLDREALAAVLRIARDTTLSQYVVGFIPEAGAKPKRHSLAVALTSKSTGRLVGGERNGVSH